MRVNSLLRMISDLESRIVSLELQGRYDRQLLDTLIDHLNLDYVWKDPPSSGKFIISTENKNV